MKIDPFLTCLAATGIETGTTILGVYSFASGNTGVVWNQMFSTGNNYYNGYPYRAAYPLIYNGAGNNVSGVFTKNQFYQISDVFADNFTAIFSLNYSGCLNTGTVNYLLASTNPNPTGTSSGVYLGITPSNRLFAKAGGFSYTIPQEIGIGDFVYFGVNANRFLNFGIFSINDNKYYGKQYDDLVGNLEVKDLCFGGALSYPSNFTGYSGKMNEVYFFSGNLKTGFIGSCVDCSFVSGYSYSGIKYEYTQTRITGSSWSNVSGTGTSYQKVLVSYPRVGGGSGYVYADSGVTGYVLSYQTLLPGTQQFTGTGYFSGLTVLYDNAPRLSGSLFDLQFDLGLVSGDVVEVYTYPTFNTNVNYRLNSFAYPYYSGEVQLYGNGLAETSGVDYRVLFNNQISGFDTSDVMVYDFATGTYSMDYTTGNNNVKTGACDARYIRITGAKDVDFSFPFKWDVYFDGQKMASGFDFTIVQTGSNMAGIISDTSGAYNLAFYDINATNGNYLELKFVPRPTSVMQKTFSISGNQFMVSGISGFSEQVWVNGIRQAEIIDYSYTPRCRFCSGQFFEQDYQFSLYSSVFDTTGFFQVVNSSPLYLLDFDGNTLLDMDNGIISEG